jgi:uncharacterized membrane protein YuzA (DUF378 family)
MNNINKLTETKILPETVDTIDKISASIVILAVMNWSISEIMDYNLINRLFEDQACLREAIYLVIAICGINLVSIWRKVEMRNVHS